MDDQGQAGRRAGKQVRTFIRIVKMNPPTVSDFVSNAAKGRPIPWRLPANLHWLWDGNSVYETAEQAEEQVREFPVLGSFLAELAIPEDGPFRIPRTTRSRGHYTI